MEISVVVLQTQLCVVSPKSLGLNASWDIKIGRIGEVTIWGEMGVQLLNSVLNMSGFSCLWSVQEYISRRELRKLWSALLGMWF